MLASLPPGTGCPSQPSAGAVHAGQGNLGARLERAAILALVSALLLVGGLRSAGATDGWLVREEAGALHYRLPDSPAWSRASAGVELQSGTAVRAGNGRPAVLVRGGSSIVIRGGTELTLPAPGTTTVVQRLGRARYQIEPGSVADFLVETPYLVIGIKGTIFDVLVNEAGTEVEVSEGLVEVTTPDGRFRAVLARGQSARIGAAAGAALEVRSASGEAPAPSPRDPARSAPADQAASPEAASPRTQGAVSGALSPLTAVTRSLWSGIGALLSDVDIVHDDRLTTGRRGTLVRTLSGGIANVGGGAQGDSGGGSGGDAAGGGGASGAGGAAGTGSGAGSGNSGSGSGGGGRGGGGLGGAVGGVSSGVGGAVGGVSSGVGGAVGGGLGGAVGSVGRGVGGAVGGLGKAAGGALGKR